MTIEQLKEKRIEMGIRQREIAEALDITKTYLSLCECGVKKPTKTFLLAYEFILKKFEDFKKNDLHI